MDNRGLKKSLYVLTSKKVIERPPKMADELLKIDADEKGRILFRAPVEESKLQQTFNAHVELMKGLLQKLPTMSGGIELESVTLKLGVDAEVGCVFLADASVEASIEVEFKKSTPRKPDVPPIA